MQGGEGRPHSRVFHIHILSYFVKYLVRSLIEKNCLSRQPDWFRGCCLVVEEVLHF